MAEYTSSPKQFDDFVAKAESASQDIRVVLVANLQDSPAERGKSDRVHLEDRYFSSRTVNSYAEALRRRGMHVEVLQSEHELFGRVVSREFLAGPRDPVVYNLTEAATGPGGMSLIPAFCDRYGIRHCNSSPHGSTMGRHKYHSAQLLDKVGVPTPETWCWSPGSGWRMGDSPPRGTKVIIKSTFESFSVGVGPDSVGAVGRSLEERVRSISEEIGQQVVVQEFVSGEEVAVPVIAGDPPMVPPLVGIRLDEEEPLGDDLISVQAELNSKDKVRFSYAEDEPPVQDRISKLAARAKEALGFGGISRIDFRVTDSGSPYVTDVGAVPVLYEGGSLDFSMERWGYSQSETLLGLVGAALESEA